MYVRRLPIKDAVAERLEDQLLMEYGKKGVEEMQRLAVQREADRHAHEQEQASKKAMSMSEALQQQVRPAPCDSQFSGHRLYRTAGLLHRPQVPDIGGDSASISGNRPGTPEVCQISSRRQQLCLRDLSLHACAAGSCECVQCWGIAFLTASVASDF